MSAMDIGKLNCIAVDDEPIALEGIAEFIRRIDFLNLLGQGNSALDANKLLKETKVDLMFLDIQMPYMTGFDFAASLSNPPLIIFTTAYQEFAVKGFELDVVDYLLKPFSFDRFLKSANRAYKYWEERGSAGVEESLPYIFVKTDKKYQKILFEDIYYIEGLKDYVKIFVKGGGKIIAPANLKNIELKLPDNKFFRIHKSYIVALDKIIAVEYNMADLGMQQIPIGKEYKEELFNRIFPNNLIKR